MKIHTQVDETNSMLTPNHIFPIGLEWDPIPLVVYTY